MSWSISTKLKRGNRLSEEIRQLKEIDRTNIGNAQCVRERDEQIETAINAVACVLADESMANADEVSISMSGHANPDHKPSDGWANEYVAITISVQSYKPEE